MEENLTEEYRYLKAQKRVEKIKGFYIHTIVTFLLAPVLVFINLKFSPQYHWFWFAVGGVFVGLFFHWLGVYGSNIFFGSNWEKKKIKEFMKE